MVAAQKAVDGLQPKDINDAKANKNPHILQKYVLDCVGIYFHNKLDGVKMASHLFSKKDSGEKAFLAESYEVCGKVVLSNPRLLLDLKEFEKD